MAEQLVFRVVAVRSSGDRLVVTDQLALDQAEALRSRLLENAAFSAVVVEVDDPQAGRDTEEGDSLQTIHL